MNKFFLLVVFAALLLSAAFGPQQDTVVAKLKVAKDSADHKRYAGAVILYKALYDQSHYRDAHFVEIVNGYAGALYKLLPVSRHYALPTGKLQYDWFESLVLSKEFVKLLNKHREQLNPNHVANTWNVYDNMIVSYFGLGQYEKAAPFQQMLYEDYKQKSADAAKNTTGVKPLMSYQFEFFTCNNYVVQASELFDEHGNVTGGESKQVYYVTPHNKSLPLFGLETQKLKATGNVYTLVKVTYAKNRADNKNEPLTAYTFGLPVDYNKLHAAVVEYLKCR